jgi:CheY-like chemotaxis protein
MKKSNLQGNK